MRSTPRGKYRTYVSPTRTGVQHQGKALWPGSRPSLWSPESGKGHALDFNHRTVIKKFCETLDLGGAL